MSRPHALTAFIYDKRGRLLSLGQNSYVKTHPLQLKYGAAVGDVTKPYLHAEISAIVRCPDLSKAHRLVIMRFDKEGNSKPAKPCPICQHAISLTPIKVIEHT